MVCTQQIQFWKIAAVTFDILYILCTLNRVLRPILGDRFILMCRSWYSGVDLLEFHGQSKLFSHIYFLRFLGNHSSAAPEKKKKEKNIFSSSSIRVSLSLSGLGLGTHS